MPSIFSWLTNKSKNGVLNHKVSWNFNKFLIDPHGELQVYSSSTKPFDTEIISQLNKNFMLLLVKTIIFLGIRMFGLFEVKQKQTGVGEIHFH